MLNARHDQAVAMLTDGNEVHLVVQRDRSAPLMSPLNLEPLSTDFDRSTTLDTSFGPLAQSSPVPRDTRTPSISGPAPLAGYESPFGSPRLVNGHSFESPYQIEEVTLEKVNKSLGISIAGGLCFALNFNNFLFQFNFCLSQKVNAFINSIAISSINKDYLF